jgi:hypothetical protein
LGQQETAMNAKSRVMIYLPSLNFAQPRVVRFRANRTLSRHGRMTEYDPETAIGRIKIPQRSSLWACRDVLSFRSEGPRSKHSRL